MQVKRRHTFRKYERLCSKKVLTMLFQQGKSFKIYPFLIYWLSEGYQEELLAPVKIAISVPQKNIKKVHERNLVKRRIREAFRKNKYLLYDDLEKKCIFIQFILIYLCKELISYKEIEKKIILILERIRRNLNEVNKQSNI